ncbi:PilZ domain-containing protein [Sulfitobacter donghicola]|uniref:PilZ domain-containing protein n=1 Tax=Sulfitobacter donghicola DSW-25 = KCTC 12864 = JCM 14565 TaxID=1300350 RepID=A0A073IIT6_9RHOB|nr:PilZ domain-containing protein [Sulfitobacter donghicola]KEJ89669.1 hypothetical protein DSW25_11350 [Sulfitobacter donghicola DSW-25 = KCTC 12864 = JCM 14565]KIN69416.1 hypothetical protein Z948_3157 [Sulfitobacter donghicola DSW-25 = KCTC 12864 = JCM 14565]
MKYTIPFRALPYLFSLFMAATGSSAQAAGDKICSSVIQLEGISRKGSKSQVEGDRHAAIDLLNTLVTNLKSATDSNANLALVRVGAKLEREARELQSLQGSGQGKGTGFDQILHRFLSRNLGELALVYNVFGCDDLKSVNTIFKASETEYESQSFGGMQALLRKIQMVSASIWAGLILALSAAAYGIFKMRKRTRGARKLCYTSMVVRWGGDCTFTHILDISRRGMKIEAAKGDQIGEGWIDLYFCGHKVQGKVVWRNKYYSGIRFRERISPRVLQSVVGTSGKPLEETGFEENATSCYSKGCHLTCVHHLKTEISEEKAAS